MFKVVLLVLCSILGSSAFATSCNSSTEDVSEDGYVVMYQERGVPGMSCIKYLDLTLEITNPEAISGLELARQGLAVYLALNEFRNAGVNPESFCPVESLGMKVTRENKVELLFRIKCYGKSVESLEKIKFLPNVRKAQTELSYKLVPQYPAFPGGGVVHN